MVGVVINMKKNKKTFIIISISLITVTIISLLIYFIASSSSSNKLSLEENRWIDTNRKNVIDIAIMNDIPVLSYNGEGLIYNYLDYVTDKHSLKFNIITYKLDGNIQYDYKLDMVSTVNDNDIVLLDDNLVLITSDRVQYNNIKDVTNLKIGVHTSDKVVISNYFNGNTIEYVEYSTYTELKQSLNQTTSEEVPLALNGIIIPKTIYTKELLENNYKISFNMNDLKKYFVLKTKGNNELSNILKKSYNVWKEKNYETSYNSNLLSNYFEFKKLSETEQKKLQSKSYTYGFIEYGIYNHLEMDKISGFNELILKDFNKFSGLSVAYTKYNNINNLLSDFNVKKVDFMLNIYNPNSYIVSNYNTVGVFNKDLAIISGITNTDVIESVISLKNKEVSTIKDSYLEKYLTDYGVKVKLYNNLDDLVTDFSNDSIAIIDLENYNYYKTSTFKDSKLNILLDNREKYNYVINNDVENKMFEDIFDFYLNYSSVNKLIYNNYEDIAYENINVVYILILVIIALCIYLVLDFSNHLKYMIKSMKKNKKINLTKEEKIKYIDQLTSLKNRAYLNSRIESWDASEVYPQSIIIIDLNNVSYINDNYGREEGDKVITEAANILIQHQMQNSEIIRTDGNEFLIYLVGYNEKQIISYRRKLTKELKNLSHGFGAASGYSIINDAIKTIDDAVNEATLDMRENKEDIDY